MVALLLAVAAPLVLVALALGLAALHPGARSDLRVRDPRSIRSRATALPHGTAVTGAAVAGAVVVVLPPDRVSAQRR